MHGTRLKSTRPDGVVMYQESETIEWIPDSKVVIRSRISPYRGGHMEMLVTRTLDPVPEGTLLTSIRECRVRPWYMGHIASAREYVAVGCKPKGASIRSETLLSALRGSSR